VLGRRPNGPAFSRRCPHAYCTALATRRVAGNGRLQREVGGLLVQAEEGEDGGVAATRSGRAAGRNQMRARKITAGRLLQKRADRTAMVQSVRRSVVASAAFAARALTGDQRGTA
jgi:hypothetical protein